MSQMGAVAGIGPRAPITSTDPKVGIKGDGDAFKSLLKDKIDSSQPQSKAPLDQIKFSAHAVDRMQSRGISLGPDGMERLASAIEKATQKGAKDTLVLLNDSALIVNVKSKTVVTAMDKDAMKDNIFTNIDSTVIA